MTTFDPWLRQLAAAGRLAPEGLTIDRGLPFVWRFALAGDWTGADVVSSLRAEPDGFALVATFATANQGYASATGRTTFSLALTAAQTAALPTDPAGEAVVPLAWDVIFTPSGGAAQRLFGGAATVLGKVTNA